MTFHIILEWRNYRQRRRWLSRDYLFCFDWCEYNKHVQWSLKLFHIMTSKWWKNSGEASCNTMSEIESGFEEKRSKFEVVDCSWRNQHGWRGTTTNRYFFWEKPFAWFASSWSTLSITFTSRIRIAEITGLFCQYRANSSECLVKVKFGSEYTSHLFN